jgi:hypothetical protein
MEQGDFMEEAEMHYPMAWSVVYFLEASDEAREEPRWARILPTYYETLKAAFTRERARLAAEAKAEDTKALKAASKLAREEAVTAAFQGVDLKKIESAWSSFVWDLKLPR